MQRVLKLILGLFVGIVQLGGISTQPAQPAEAPTVSNQSYDPETFIEALIRQQKFQEAEKLLRAVRETGSRSNQILFLSGTVAGQLGRHSEAISFFRQLLGRDPTLVRVRLELARAFFQIEDDDNAKRNFELVLGGDLPPAVVANVQRFLDEIRRRKATRYSFGIALVPSTNINQAPNVRTVTLFGLPFRLDDAAQRKTGIGAVTRGSAERFQKLSENLRLRLGSQLIHTDYANNDFDDTLASVHIGPQFIRRRSDHSILGRISNRYFGGEFFSQTRQFSLQSDWQRSSRTRLRNAVGFGRTLFNHRAAQNSNFSFIAPSLTRVLNSFSLVRLGTSLRIENARNNVFSYTSWSFSVAYQRDFPLGITIVAHPKFFRRSFDERQAVFNATRLDTLYGASLTFLKRDFRIRGFAPQVTFEYARNRSTIELFAYTRTLALFGITRDF